MSVLDAGPAFAADHDAPHRICSVIEWHDVAELLQPRRHGIQIEQTGEKHLRDDYERNKLNDLKLVARKRGQQRTKRQRSER